MSNKFNPKSSPKTDAPTGTKEPAPQLLIKLLKENGLDFFIKKPNIRFIEDNGIIIDPPQVVIFYKSDAEKAKLEQAQNGSTQ